MNGHASIDWYRRQPLFWWACLFAAGIMLEYYISGLLLASIIIIVLFGTVISFRGNPVLRVIFVMVVVCSFGILLLASNRNVPDSLIQKLADNEYKVMYTGKVSSLDSTRNGYQYAMTNPLRVYEKEISANPIQIWLPDYSHHIKPGDTLIAAGIFSRYPRARNPGEFDYRKYQSFNRLYFQFSVEYPWEMKILPCTTPNAGSWVAGIREQVHDLFQNALSAEGAAFADALILGNRDMIDENIIDTYSQLGVIHVMAVSGLHVGFVVLILLILSQIIPVNYRYRVMIVLIGLFFYAWLIDFRPSVFRASTMAGFFLLASAFERRYRTLNILGLAAIIILAIDPLQLFMLGFQLSFVAVLGIILIYERMSDILELKGIKIADMHPLVKYFAGMLLVSFAAFLATIPITAYHFRTIPVYGILVNILVIPAIGFIVINLFLVVLAGIIWSPAGEFLAALPDTLIRLLNISLTGLQQIGLGALQIPHFPWVWTILAYVCMVLFVLWKYAAAKRIFLYGSLLGINVLVFVYGNSTDTFRVTFFDVGQADAALIEAPDNVNILIDAGDQSLYSDSGKRVLIPYFQYQGIDHLDILVLSHPHADHIGGALSVLNALPVQEIWTINEVYNSDLYKQILATADNQGVTIRQITAGYDTTIGAMNIVTYFPLQGFTGDNINNHSIVQKFCYGENSVIFSGDIEVEIDEILYPFDSLLNAEIFKVPHHGSITSSSVKLLELVSPDHAVISVGKGNKFGHPSEIVLERYAQAGISAYLTQDHGAVIFETDGINWKRINWY